MSGQLDLHSLEILGLFRLISVVHFAGLAKYLKIPFPILLVLVGLAISFVPHVPRIPLDPQLVFLVFLPPLLYASAWQINWRDFHRNLLSISMLATGLVVFTVLGIAFFADRFVTTLDFTSGFLLGAVVAATDAVATGSIAKTLGLSPRISTLLEGESLLNDATGLLALEFGLTLLLSGHTLSFGESVLRLSWLIAGGLGVGLLLGSIMTVIERWIDDGPLEVATSLIVPYVAYLAAEELRASGVLAVVVCGLYLSRRSASFLSPTSRLELLGAWKALDFMLNGIVFLLIGLQLPYILLGIHEYTVGQLLFYGLVFSLLLIALRMIWAFPGAYTSAWIRRRLFHQEVPNPQPKGIFVVGWAGMRGVLALAAAFSLPITLPNGHPFTQRPLILFLTFSIILVTLVGQGLTLPFLIRRLGLANNTEVADEELAARFQVLSKVIASLKQSRTDASIDDMTDIDELLLRYRHRLDAISVYDRISHTAGPVEDAIQATNDRHERRADMVRKTVMLERQTLLNLRERNTIGDDVLHSLERELDLTETRLETGI
jgi:Na+/H+ antiporter